MPDNDKRLNSTIRSAIWINGTTYKIDTFYLDLLAQHKFGKDYSEYEAETNTYLRTLLPDRKLSASEIEKTITLKVIPKKLQTSSKYS